MKSQNRRLDVLLVSKGLATSRKRALGLILAGKVLVNDDKVTKAGARVPENASIRITGNDMRYVSRGGIKLEAAIRTFQIDIAGCKCLDVGASTGGFTDCLLQHGANHVIAVDVGYGQLDWKLRTDPRVTVLERTNIRYLTRAHLDESVDLACIDVSFISLKLALPAILQFIKSNGHIICLIKPQFEVGKGLVGKRGVVRDPALHKAVIDNLDKTFWDLGLRRLGLIPSPILGAKGNQEFLALLTPVRGAVNME